MRERIIIGEDTKGPEAYCPVCHSLLDGFMSIGSKKTEMQPGDWSICAYCGVVLEVRAKGVFIVMPKDKVRNEMAINVNFRAAYHAVQRMLFDRPI